MCKKINILQRCDSIWSGHQYLKLASLSSSSKTECKTIHLSELWGQPNSVTAISAYKRKETKNNGTQLFLKAQTWTIKCKFLCLFSFVLTFTHEVLHRELTKIKINGRLSFLLSFTLIIYPKWPKTLNHHNLKSFIITCQQT